MVQEEGGDILGRGKHRHGFTCTGFLSLHDHRHLKMYTHQPIQS